MAGTDGDDFLQPYEDEETNDVSDALPKKADQKTPNRNVLRKATDVDFMYKCEWNDCCHISYSMNQFNHHLSLHRRGYTQCLGSDKEASNGDYVFFCQWRGCHAHIEGQIDDFCRHVYYHTFHQYLKFLGKHVQSVEGLNDCLLDTSSRNVIPELPEKLMCRWQDCGMVYDNPYIFYSHVSHHCEDFPKGHDPKVKIRCLWEGCKAVTKSWYKMKEHMRSHTQAKVVACPNCGSLFANNTRFIDHLKRQSMEIDQKFQCSHCNSRFGSERILRDHMRHHVNHFKCPLCDMTCNSPSGVRDHVRYRHSEERSFSCQHCPYKGKTFTDLRRHSVIHVEKNIFSCKKTGCTQVFNTKQLLMSHYREDHERPQHHYQCHVCCKSFARGSYLTVHLRDVHKYKWPSGHKKFRYKLHEDGIHRLQTIRYESIEVSQQVLGQTLSSPSHTGDKDQFDHLHGCEDHSDTDNNQSGPSVGPDLTSLTGAMDENLSCDQDKNAKSSKSVPGPSVKSINSSDNKKSVPEQAETSVSFRDIRKKRSKSIMDDGNGESLTHKKRKSQKCLKTGKNHLSHDDNPNDVHGNETEPSSGHSTSYERQEEANIDQHLTCHDGWQSTSEDAGHDGWQSTSEDATGNVGENRNENVFLQSISECHPVVDNVFDKSQLSSLDNGQSQETLVLNNQLLMTLEDLAGKDKEATTPSADLSSFPSDNSTMSVLLHSHQVIVNPTSDFQSKSDIPEKQKILAPNVPDIQTTFSVSNLTFHLSQTSGQSPVKQEPGISLDLASPDLLIMSPNKVESVGQGSNLALKTEVCPETNLPPHQQLVKTSMASVIVDWENMSQFSGSTCQREDFSLISSSQTQSHEPYTNTCRHTQGHTHGYTQGHTVVSLEKTETDLIQGKIRQSVAVIKQEPHSSGCHDIYSTISEESTVTVTDSSATGAQGVTEIVSRDVDKNVLLMTDNNGGFNFHELYNLQMLGDVALSSQDK